MTAETANPNDPSPTEEGERLALRQSTTLVPTENSKEPLTTPSPPAKPERKGKMKPKSSNPPRKKWVLWARNVGLSLLSLCANPFSIRKPEEPKIVIHKSALISLLRCSIHVVPIATTAVLAYFNLAGYFRGGELNGRTATSQAGDLLALQIAAKVMVGGHVQKYPQESNRLLLLPQELWIVASLASIVCEAVRTQALSPDGIPLGLFGAGIRFSQLSYLLSPAFLIGGQGVRSITKRMLLMLLIVVSGLLALFVGPSSALLLIPGYHDGWSAGDTGFWLVGTKETLWPDVVDGNHIGGNMCRNPTDDNITAAELTTSSCIWHGFTEIAEGIKSRHFDWQSNITVNDGVVKRQFTRQQAGAVRIAPFTETWVYGVHVATARISRILADEWITATQFSSTTNGTGSLSNYQHAAVGAGAARVGAWLPAVRTQCLRSSSIGNLSGETSGPVSASHNAWISILMNLTVSRSALVCGYQSHHDRSRS